MHIKFHILSGIIPSILMQNPMFLFGSILPDAALIKNELNLKIKNKKFNPNTVDNVSLFIYRGTHSLFFVFLCLFINKQMALGILCHQILDWASHSGRFSARPFFPFSYKLESRSKK